MEKEFVTYELALRMKALGFDEPCFGAYGSLNNYELHLYKTPSFFDYGGDNSCLAPTWQSAFAWFREKFKIQGYVYSHTVRGNKEGQVFSDYIYVINGIGMDVIQTDARDQEFDSYEEAESKCLDKICEIVEKQKEDENTQRS